MQTTSEEGGVETDEQLCQVDFAPLGKGNLPVWKGGVGVGVLEVTHTHTHTVCMKRKEDDAATGGGGGRRRKKEEGGGRRRKEVSPCAHCTSPPSALKKIKQNKKAPTVSAGTNCRCASLPS